MTWLIDLLRGDVASERVVPPSGFAAVLTTASAAAMAFLAVFALALALSAGRQADRWQSALVDRATVRVSAPEDQMAERIVAVETILSQTPGIGATRRLGAEEQRALLAPWFGGGIPVDTLRLPELIDVELDGDGPDAAGLQQRFAAEAPGAVYDDHGRWRAPLVAAASGLRSLAMASLVLIAGVTAVTIALAASTAIAASGQVIDVLRLVGAEDAFITRAFVRRFTLRALAGAAGGTVLGLIAVALLPGPGSDDHLVSVGLRGWDWLWPFMVPAVAAALAFAATRFAARRRLSEVS